MKIGKPVFKRDGARTAPDFISSDCAIAGHHIEQGIGSGRRSALRELRHPLRLLRMRLRTWSDDDDHARSPATAC